MKKVGIAMGAILGLAALFAAAVVGVASRDFATRAMRTWDVDGPALNVRYGDAEALARGEHLARAVSACVECHGDDFGGRVFLDDPALGRFVGPNLTTGQGGRGPRLGEADWSRAITRGVGDSHRSLVLMPAADFQNLSVDDVSAIVAYARTRPPVDRDPGTTAVAPFGKVLNWLGKAPIFSAEELDMTRPPPSAVPPGRTVEYGRYLAGACVGCHRPDYRGGPMVGTPPGCPAPANLTPTGLPDYTEADFVRAMREGKALDGHALNPFMPFAVFANMTDDELGAVFLFLKSLPPTPTGT